MTDMSGKAERFVGLTRQEALQTKNPVYFNDAEGIIKKYVDFYNKRYHAGINYLRPADVFSGKDQEDITRKAIEIAKSERN